MNIGFIGIGSMGGMLVRELLRREALSPKDVFAANRTQAKLDALLLDFPGIHVVSNTELAAACNLIFVCVHATDMPPLLAQIGSNLGPNHLLVSTSATVSLKMLEERVPCRTAKLVPSITQEIGAGIAVLMYSPRSSREDRSLLEGLLGHISQPVVIPEALARPAIGLTSAGPALIAYMLQCMADEAARSNPEMPPELARKLLEETASATMRLVKEANMNWEEIIRRVAVPGGMTEFAMEILSRYVPQAWQTVFQEMAARESRSLESLAL